MTTITGLVSVGLSLALTLPAAPADPPAARFTVVTPKPLGVVAAGLNGRGDLVGFEWREEKDHPDVLSQVAIFARGKDITYLPLLEGYTATFPAAVSDDGLVVGRAGKPAPRGVKMTMRNQAFVWDAAGGMRGLGVLPGDLASSATGVCRDGRTVSGSSVGEGRVRACVWNRDGEGWSALALPQQANLGSNTVALSPGGRYATAVDGLSACLWLRDAAGVWTRAAAAEPGAITPRAVNDAGTVVGLRALPDGTSRAVVWTRDGAVKTLDPPEGFVTAEANAVNAAGVVVGLIDGPPGSKTGPNAFVCENGRLRVLTEGGPNFAGANALNDRNEVSGVFEEKEDAPPR